MEETAQKSKRVRSKKKRRRFLIRFVTILILIFALIGFITVVALIAYGISRLVQKPSEETPTEISSEIISDNGPTPDPELPDFPIPDDTEPVSGSNDKSTSEAPAASVQTDENHLAINLHMLTKNPYSRPGTALAKINAVVIHYTASPGGTAEQNREYFEDLKVFKTRKASAHFIVGLKGEIVQCIPTKEIAYASNDRNKDTVAIECCHSDDSGKFNEATLDSVKKLTAWLLVKNGLSAEDGIIRHYDVSGKLCPKYFVEHEDEWKKFKKDVADYISENKTMLASADYLSFKEYETS